MEGNSVRAIISGALLLALSGTAPALAQTNVPVVAAPVGPQPPPPRPLLPFALVRLDPAFDAIIAPGTQLDTVATIPGLNAEGPLWHEGRLWVSDQRGGRIYAIALDGKVETIAENAGGPIDPALRVNQGPNGELAYKDGGIIVMRQGLRDVGHRGKDGAITSFLPNYQGKKFNSPNDMVFSPDGTLWFTDPPFSLPKTVPADLPYAAVFRLRNGVLTPVITDMNLPNGIALSPGGKILYVNNTRPDMYIRAYDVAPDGTLSNQRELIRFASDPAVRGVPDGMKVDSSGNIWTTGPGGILVLAPSGKILGRIQLPATATNIAFGDDFHSVFFTSGPTIYRIRSLVKGQIPKYFTR
jgi:gluconolactonase